ncbi:MAG: hypothetical protein WC732_02120 [Candidatus Omnitrophota bacterium]
MLKKYLSVVLVVAFIVSSAGCETLRKKFIRKRKTPQSREAMIITPRDYSAHPFPNHVLYRQYFTYWKAWNQELVTALNDRASHKKVVDCMDQALINLKKMSTYLLEDKAKSLAAYIQQSEALMSRIQAVPGLPQAEAMRFRYTAERILSSVNRQFDPTDMKNHLKPDPA